jgi:hypothetical protein
MRTILFFAVVFIAAAIGDQYLHAEKLTASLARDLSHEVNSINLRLTSQIRAAALSGKYELVLEHACGESENNLKTLGYSVNTLDWSTFDCTTACKTCVISWAKK